MAWAEQAATADAAKAQIGVLVRTGTLTGDDALTIANQEQVNGVHLHAKDLSICEPGDRQDLDPPRALCCHGDRRHMHHNPVASRTTTRIGVGLKPLQGLFTCGQLEITNSTSMSAVAST